MKPNKFKTTMICILILILFTGIQLVIGMFSGIAIGVYSAIAGVVFEDLIASMQSYIALAGEIAVIIIFGLWFYLGFNRNRNDKHEMRNSFNSSTLCFIFCSTIFVFSFALLISNVISALWPASMELYNNLMSSMIGENRVIGYLTVMLLAPIAEEIVFRGIILQKSKEAFGFVGCIILNAILFSISHLNPLQSLYVLPIAVLYTFLAYHYKTVFASIIAHVLNNSLGVVIPLLIGRAPSNLETMISLIIFGALTYMLVKRNRANELNHNKMNDEPESLRI